MMSEGLKLEIQVISTVHIVAILLAIVFLMIFYMKAQKDSALKAFLVLQSSSILWMIFKIFKTVSPNIEARWWFIVGYYVCAIVLEVAFVEFSYAYYKGKFLAMKARKYLYILPLLQVIAVVSNPYHHLFYAHFDFWGDSFGPLFYLHTVLVYSFIAVGFTYSYKAFKVRLGNKSILHRILVSAAIVLPLVLNFFFITKLMHRFIYSLGFTVMFDITPIVFTWSTLVFVYSTFKYEFIAISPLMKHEIVHHLDTAIAVLDSSYQPIYANKKMNRLLGSDAMSILSKYLNKKTLAKEECIHIIGGKHFRVFAKKVNSLKENQYLVTFKDISAYKDIEHELMCQQEELENSNLALSDAIRLLKHSSKIGARNYVARELHDIIGHSLVVTIKLLEVSQMYFNSDYKLSREALIDCQKTIDEGVETMSRIAFNEKMEMSFSGLQLEKDVQKLLSHVEHAGIRAKLIVRGSVDQLPRLVYQSIKKVITELITNTLKHAQAKDLFIAIHLSEEQIDLRVMDNGIGCKVFVEGNGLKGIHERLKPINGSLTVTTQEKDGFMSLISVPISVTSV